MYVAHLLHPFICQWTFRLLTCLGYCKQYCSVYQRVCILSHHSFLQIYAHEWGCCIICLLYLQFLRESPYCFPQQLYQFVFPQMKYLWNIVEIFPIVRAFLFSPNLFQHLFFYRLFDDGHSDQCEVISHCRFDLHFTNNQ